MAWYALYKWFIQFRKIPYTNYITWFTQCLYDEWFHGLSEDKQKEELKCQIELRKKGECESQMALAQLGMLYQTMDRMMGGKMSCYMKIYKDLNKRAFIRCSINS